MNKDKKPLSITHPDIAKEAYGWDPDLVTFGSQKILHWICKEGHRWKARVSDRTLNSSDCPICSNQKVLAGFNDLATTHPELAKEAYGWDPKAVVAGTNKKLGWMCTFGHTWRASGVQRLRIKEIACPFCRNSLVLEGFNDLLTTHPELAKEAYGWDPKTVMAGTNKKLHWICQAGHKWEAAVERRVRQSHGCPFCGNKKRFVGFNDLLTTHPELAKEAYGWDPKTVMAGTNKKLHWICQAGHKWEATLKDRSQKKSGCPTCSNRSVLEGFNDLLTTHPELAKEACGWDPKTVVAGTNKKLYWICGEGHKWKASGNSRIVNKSGCPSCAKTGFNPTEKGYLYFLLQPNWEIYQIGITNDFNERFKSHKKNGFELLELRGPMDGHTAQELETAILRFLKSQKADLSPEHIAGKFDGYSESWTMNSFKVNNLKELIDKAREAGY
jgi:predicted GIY-YIG superfamily endonuclease